MEIGKALMASDILIVLAAAWRFGMGTGLYCILGLIGKSFVVDFLLLKESVYCAAKKNPIAVHSVPSMGFFFIISIKLRFFYHLSCWSIKTSINFPTVINVVTLHFFSFAAISSSMMLSHFAYGVSSKK